MNISFTDLKGQYVSIKEEIDDAIYKVIETSSFIRGPFVEQFEENFSNLMNSKHCISCANGTDALYISMIALGVKPGDEVIVPAHSWISTSETVTQAGAKVVFCDTNTHNFTIDTALIEEKITSKTVGIIPVHLFGHPAKMDVIMKIANKHNLWVLEDCAQAHLAKFKGQKVGTFGNAASFSFYPGKNLGAMGDAGAIITNDSNLARKMAVYARHGGLNKGDHEIEGINSRLDGLQAAILNVKLKHLEKWTKLRQSKALLYDRLLSKIGNLTIPSVSDECEHVWHLYVVKSERRDELKKFLSDHKIPTIINYRTSLPFLPAYKRFNHKPTDYPTAFFNQSRILSLPLCPELPESHIKYISDKIIDFFADIECCSEF